MGQEYFINNQKLEDKIRKSLPSQGGAGAGFDLSASTQIIPTIDVTESAEGSNLRQDLQTSMSFNDIMHTVTTNTTNNIITNTGYFRVFGNFYHTGTGNAQLQLTDGVSTKVILNFGGGSTAINNIFDINVFLSAGDILQAVTSNTATILYSTTRQIADINGSLTDPT